MTRSIRPALAAATLATLVMSTGCGPFGYLGRVAKDASRSVADAKAAQAEELAPYEYWGSVAYLDQAKVMMAYSEYERSFDYGDRATQLADAAKKKSERTSQGITVERSEDVAAPDEMVEAPAQGEAAAPAEGTEPAAAEGGAQ